MKVEGVTTGIKHSSVEVKYDSKLSNFDKNKEDNMIFALYNKNGYITYAVVVGKTAGSSESMVYLTSGIKSKSLENGDYIYTYEAITKDGAVTVNSFESKDNSTPRANLVLGNLYEGTFDKNNVITEMEKQTNTDSGPPRVPLCGSTMLLPTISTSCWMRIARSLSAPAMTMRMTTPSTATSSLL